ncbi:glucokinase [Roseibium porphyridii]|uniref:Glucokinase n=1 Tax=Roseibium porphyridii TaxID=2866279 RepID=A0ABY8F312_9HYPH|nr:glucokinase [Roseibium sp. KMA01]WFE89875.1 glucokinase [Roseibium sp. KMA01]
MTNVLCDLGGTNCRFALSDVNNMQPKYIACYSNQKYDTFEEVLTDYIHEQQIAEVQSLVVALAAPVEGDSIKLTNRDWKLDKSILKERLGVKHIHFLNDFEALGYSLTVADELSFNTVLKPSVVQCGGPKLVLGAGTGFNCVLLTPKGEVVCAEAGHSTLVTETPLDRQLQREFIVKYGRCSIERILSGNGIVEIYNAICSNNHQRAIFNTSHEIAEAGCNETDIFAFEACKEFSRILGRTAGDLALLTLPYSGIFLTGGITRALKRFIGEPGGSFSSSFFNKGRMREHMSQFPVFLLSDDHVALYGCGEFLSSQNQT